MKPLGITMIVLALASAALLVGAELLSTSKPATHPGKELTLDLGDNVTLKLVQIPAGKFLMGSPATENSHDADEAQHEVTISKPFYMGTTPVTVDQFAAFVKDTGHKTAAEDDGWSYGFVIEDGQLVAKNVKRCTWRTPSFEQKGDHPVIQVSWNDAIAFCTWLSKKSGKSLTLPTEAQWEYACRAGTATAYPWGDDPDDGKGSANTADQSLQNKLPNSAIAFFDWDDGFAFTSPVTTFKPNAFGLYDMGGNVCQWCQDRYGDYDKGAAIDPAGPKTGSTRIQRGGSWYNPPANCRAAFRRLCAPEKRYDDDGFRVVVTGLE